jgi:hypothetical protein
MVTLWKFTTGHTEERIGSRPSIIEVDTCTDTGHSLSCYNWAIDLDCLVP